MKPATQSRIDLVLPSFPISFDSIFAPRCSSHQISCSREGFASFLKFPIRFDRIRVDNERIDPVGDSPSK